ncbi:MAG: SAM-dependent methyltransferase [Cyanobium sp. M30B3]|nr:MAG: SAM-dependent methyltransferase [Cyanobium sp. M30B3]
MTCSACGAEAGPLRPRLGADGSFSLWSERFGEGFHGGIGALSEARAKFVHPAQLERFPPGRRLRVVDVGFGLGTNSAALREAAEDCGLELEVWGLECDPQPLRQALATPTFRNQWRQHTVCWLEGLLAGGGQGSRGGVLLWGDARLRLPELLGARHLAGRCDLVLLDAFSPQRCPELWSHEFLGQLARLLEPQARLLTYCCAAAVRRSLMQAGLQLASIQAPRDQSPRNGDLWSFGTAASPTGLPGAATAGGGPLRPLSAMERDHLDTRASEPYRDPSGQTDATEILAARRRAQAASSASSTSAWRRRWGLERGT